MAVGKNDLSLNGGAIIPIPEPVNDGSNQRVSQAIMWGEVVYDPKPFVEKTRKRGQLLKINLILRFGRKLFQKVSVPQDSPFYFAVRALKRGDRVLVAGLYSESDGWVRDKETGEVAPRIDEKTGEQKIYRELYVGFLSVELATTDPDEWRRRLHDIPDPFYEADMLLEEREARSGAREVHEFTNDTLDLGMQREW